MEINETGVNIPENPALYLTDNTPLELSDKFSLLTALRPKNLPDDILKQARMQGAAEFLLEVNDAINSYGK